MQISLNNKQCYRTPGSVNMAGMKKGMIKCGHLQEYMRYSDTPGNALYKQKLGECVKQTLAKYHSDPQAGY